MEAVIRKPYQGVTNIIRFNWHFYVIAGVVVAISLISASLLINAAFWLCIMVAGSIVISTCISLVVSYHIYDRSGLYAFTWFRQFGTQSIRRIVNIHAGFDETSSILKVTFPDADLKIFDFYDRAKHTEISIQRARKAYPPYQGTVKIATSELPVAENSLDLIFNIFSLHEVRDRNERIDFLKEQVRVLRHDGKVVLVEHLRDVPNFLAYNIGFFHFVSGKEWSMNFQQAGLCINNKFNITPFITVFILRKVDGITS